MSIGLKNRTPSQQQHAARRTAWILAAVAAAMFALSLWQGLAH
ncbi:MAG: hypothetical protein ABIY40_02470 [Rhodanobacteraceae bacterium]